MNGEVNVVPEMPGTDIAFRGKVEGKVVIGLVVIPVIGAVALTDGDGMLIGVPGRGTPAAET